MAADRSADISVRFNPAKESGTKGLMRSGSRDSTLPPLPREAPSIAPTALAFALASPDFCAASTCCEAAAILFDQACRPAPALPRAKPPLSPLPGAEKVVGI